MSKYGRKAGQKVKIAMRERKRRSLRSGRSGKKVTSRQQAIATGLSEQPGRRKPPLRKLHYRLGLIGSPSTTVNSVFC